MTMVDDIRAWLTGACGPDCKRIAETLSASGAETHTAGAGDVTTLREAASAILEWFDRDGSVGGLAGPMADLRAALTASPAPRVPAAVPEEWPTLNTLADWLVQHGGIGTWAASSAARALLLRKNSPFRTLAASPAAPPADGGTEGRLRSERDAALNLARTIEANYVDALSQLDKATLSARTPAGAAGDPVGNDAYRLEAALAEAAARTAEVRQLRTNLSNTQAAYEDAIATVHELATRPASPAPAASAGGVGATYGIIDPDYARVFTMARCLAWQEGYALMMHGSFTRDLDLLAVPWAERVCEPEHLVRRLAEAADLRIITDKPGGKAHGRFAWTLRFDTFGDPRFVDFSVMPRGNGDIGDIDRIDYLERQLTAALAPAAQVNPGREEIARLQAQIEQMRRDAGKAAQTYLAIEMDRDRLVAILAARPGAEGDAEEALWKWLDERRACSQSYLDLCERNGADNPFQRGRVSLLVDLAQHLKGSAARPAPSPAKGGN